jgi:hypothetical protein
MVCAAATENKPPGQLQEIDDLHYHILAVSKIAAEQPLGQPFLVKSEHFLRLFVRWPVPSCRPSLTPRALADARPDFTRSLIRSRSNSARPAMIVRIARGA